MKITKKFLGALLTVAILAVQAAPLTVLADQTSTESLDPKTGSTGAKANVLDYTIEKVVVPTTLQIALNPNGYEVNTRYVEGESGKWSSSGVYYAKDSSGHYSITKSASADTVEDFYTAVSSSAQVVSLNYGIANKSTEAKVVKVDIKATYADTTNGSAARIQFVNTANEAAPKTQDNGSGALRDEFKMYLEIASASATPTAATTFDLASGHVNGTKYYTRSESGSSGNYVYEKASPQPGANDFSGDTLYFKTTHTIGKYVTSKDLGDVDMTLATDGRQTFAFDADTSGSKASVGYTLDVADYQLKDGAHLDFETVQDDMKDKLEMKTLGGVTAFTITGAVNKDADWSKAPAKFISITPIYTIENANGEETKVSGTLNQIVLGPVMTISNAGVFTISGLSSTNAFKDLTIEYDGTSYTMKESERGTWSPNLPTSTSEGTFTFTPSGSWIDLMTANDLTATLTYTVGGEDKTISKAIVISD
jgi:hypothetical protein